MNTSTTNLILCTTSIIETIWLLILVIPKIKTWYNDRQENKKAYFSFYFNDNDKLTIFNTGNCDATNIKFEENTDRKHIEVYYPKQDGSIIFANDQKDYLVLGSYPYDRTILITWDDKFAQNRTENFTF